MKPFFKIFILFILINSGAWMTSGKASAQVSVSFQVFYDDLSPYGTWVESPQYGYVWVPEVSRGFSPYSTNGHWVYTDFGWTWVSDYPWGWAPFHYGRWYSDPIYGSMWVPDYEWGPGWVTWRRSEGYYGWAPIEPGISISIAYSSGYRVADDRYTFVRDRDFGRSNINNYYVDRSTNTTIINNTTVINNPVVDNARHATYNAGPDRSEVEKRVGTPIAPVAIKESSKPGQNLNNNQLEIYRPQVQKNNEGGHKAAPAKVASLKDLKPAAQRTGEVQPIKETAPIKEQPAKQQPSAQPATHPPMEQQRKDHPAKQQTTPPQRNLQPVREQPAQQQNKVQPAKQQQPTEQRKDQPAEQQPSNHPDQRSKQQQQRKDQPAQQQPSNQPDQQKRQQTQPQQAQPQREVQPARQQPAQRQRNAKPAKQPAQQQQPQREAQPVKQQQPPQNESQPKQEPVKQQEAPPKQSNPADNKENNRPR